VLTNAVVQVGLVMYDTEVSKFSRIGTIAKVMSFTPLPDGRILTINEGGERFRVLKVTREGTQMEYIKALVEYVDDDDIDEDISSLEVRVWMLLTQVLSLSNTLYGKSLDLKDRIKQLAPETGDSSEVSGSADAEETDEADKEELTQVQRQRLFSFAVSQVLDMPLRDQQLMLQSRNTVERLSKQIALLQKAQQYLAAQVSLKNVFGSSGEDS
jgi:Lon protease-like protein